MARRTGFAAYGSAALVGSSYPDLPALDWAEGEIVRDFSGDPAGSGGGLGVRIGGSNRPGSDQLRTRTVACAVLDVTTFPQGFAIDSDLYAQYLLLNPGRFINNDAGVFTSANDKCGIRIYRGTQGYKQGWNTMARFPSEQPVWVQSADSGGYFPWLERLQLLIVIFGYGLTGTTTLEFVLRQIEEGA